MTTLRLVAALVGVLLAMVAFHAPICRVVACGAP